MSGITLTADDDKSFQYLFFRPSEPLSIPKGDKKFKFILPSHYVVQRFQVDPEEERAEPTANNQIIVDPLEKLPDISVPEQLDRDKGFYVFIPRHSELASALIKIFMEQPNRKTLLSTLAYCRDKVNPYLFVYACTVALVHRLDTRSVKIPSIAVVLPEKCFSKSVLIQAQVESSLPLQKRMAIKIQKAPTASDLEIEHRIAYFREDIGINLHHWHWHVIYPFKSDTAEIINKDRRGELFYYMHHQILARYNFERLCNKLHRVKRLLNLREPIVEGYFPKLDSIATSREWPSRPSNSTLKDVNRTTTATDLVVIDLDHMERLKDRILHAIDTGRVVTAKGEEILLTENDGINILGNIVEASDLSVNYDFYGNFHNNGHLVIASCHDPNYSHMESLGVMAEEMTAMRDPVFYRLHALVDDIFMAHKNKLSPYSVDKLGYPGVKIQSIEVTSDGQLKNKFKTFWQVSEVNISPGMDYRQRGPLPVKITHLQHEPFTYEIKYENSGPARLGTVRIFLAPKYDERDEPFLFNDQRLLFIELDKFIWQLEPNVNKIVRCSKDSSVTIPFEQTFWDPEDEDNSPKEVEEFCGCGWPDHMLIPQGTIPGYPCQLFVMISNYEDDRMPRQRPLHLLLSKLLDLCCKRLKYAFQTPLCGIKKVENSYEEDKRCKEAASYCGIRNRKYPDKRSMGYPFDRQPLRGVSKLKEFLTPNMAVQDVHIIFEDQDKNPKRT